MSVRAYRIITKELKKEPTFNCWNDNELIDFLAQTDYFTDNRDSDGGGSFEVMVGDLKALLNQTEIPLHDSQRKQVQDDIDSTGGDDESYIEYECF